MPGAQVRELLPYRVDHDARQRGDLAGLGQVDEAVDARDRLCRAVLLEQRQAKRGA